jgi:hypothetical protein
MLALEHAAQMLEDGIFGHRHFSALKRRKLAPIK